MTPFIRLFTFAAAAGALLAGSACRTLPPAAELPAPSTTPRYSVKTDDPDEMALLVERLKLGRVTADRGRFYFEADEAQLGRLRELGYEVTRVDPEQVDYRVIRVRRRGSEDSLRAAGVLVIAREPAYWVVSGKLAQLRRLVAAGYRLEPLGADEPRPRLIRVVVTSPEDVQRVANLQVDILSVVDTAGRYTIRGTALDMQIDRLRETGFTVELLPIP